MNVLCHSDARIETCNHLLLHCHFYIIVGRKPHSNIYHICPETLHLAANSLVMLLYGSNNYNGNISRVLKERLRYIDESFDYFRIKVETWKSNILFFFLNL